MRTCVRYFTVLQHTTFRRAFRELSTFFQCRLAKKHWTFWKVIPQLVSFSASAYDRLPEKSKWENIKNGEVNSVPWFFLSQTYWRYCQNVAFLVDDKVRCFVLVLEKAIPRTSACPEHLFRLCWYGCRLKICKWWQKLINLTLKHSHCHCKAHCLTLVAIQTNNKQTNAFTPTSATRGEVRPKLLFRSFYCVELDIFA